MSVRARELPPAHAALLAAPPNDDSGVSPVVGMILVLGISVVGIAAILYWGLPAIDEMKANVEYRSVQTQFNELDGTIRELVAGTTEKTAKRWQPSLNRGSIAVMNNSEPWLYAVELYNTTGKFNNLTYRDFADGNNKFTITNRGLFLTQAYIEGYIVTGTTSLSALKVSLVGQAGEGNQMTTTTIATTLGTNGWANGSSLEFSVWQAPGVQQKLDGSVFKLRIYNGSTVIAEAWYGNTSRIDYTLESVTTKKVIYNNGAVISEAAGQATITNTPSIPPITQTTGTPRFFGRFVQVNGTAGFAGENRFDLLISLYSTATLASYDCQLENKTDCAYGVKLFAWGKQKPVWDAYLSRTGMGYKMKHIDGGADGYFLEQRETKMAYTLLASNVRLVG